MKNIDIFVELKQIQNKLKEKSLIISQQKQEIELLKEPKSNFSTSKKSLPSHKKISEEMGEGNLDIPTLQNNIRLLEE